MPSRPFRPFVSLALTAILAAGASANGTRLPSQDDFAVARGYADVATADQPSAVYYNAAGLSQIATPEVEDGACVLTPTYDYRSPAGASASTAPRTFVLPYGYLALPVAPMNGGEATVAFGMYSPFGLSSSWPDSSGFRTLATANTVEYYTAALSAGIPLAPGLSIGGSLQYDQQHVDLNRGLGYVPGDRFHFAGHGRAASYNVGLLWQPSPRHAFGLSFQSKTDFDIRGTANLDPFGIAYSGHADWAYPEDLDIGYSYRPTPDWNLEFDWDWTNWARLKTVVLYSPTAAPVALPFDWQASSYYCLGGTRRWSSGWTASAGACLSTNSIPTATFNPAVPDATRVLLNVGPGYRTARWNIQSVLQWSPETSRTVSGTAPSAAGQSADGVYTSHLWAAGIGATYRL